MARSLVHRGPDRQTVKRAPHVALGCDRLRIIDLSPRADQPFHDAGSDCTLVCNGEIYNSTELRRRFPAYPFRSRSDVEVILPLYLEAGPRGLADLDGMFGVAIWDEVSHVLTLARDRAGEKPLFYSRVGHELWFASEVQALLEHPAISREVDETAVAQYLALGYVPEPRSIYRDVHKVPAGTIRQFATGGETELRYWAPEELAEGAGAEGATAERLRWLFREAVRKQLVADVPVGVFVSGGVDSSALAALAAREAGDRPIHTFVARFEAASYDESRWAARCAREVGSHHHEVQVSEATLLEALAAVTCGLAEPLADPAILPTFLVAREARNHVKVILSGEGADELFGGYPTYLGHRLAGAVGSLPHGVLRAARRAVSLLPSSRRGVTLEFLLKRFLADLDKPCIARHLAWFGTGGGEVLAGDRQSVAPAVLTIPPSVRGDVRRASLFDYCTYLRDGLLVKVDRATMLNSLEARAPYLDRDLTAFALGLPENLKVRGTTTKWLLKQAVKGSIPAAIVRRRKRGLSVPVASWIDGGLRGEVDRLLDRRRLGRQDLLDPEAVHRLLDQHRSRRRNHAKALWAVIVLQYWLERWAPERAGASPEGNVWTFVERPA